jgi:hypothetical protein
MSRFRQGMKSVLRSWLPKHCLHFHLLRQQYRSLRLLRKHLKSQTCNELLHTLLSPRQQMLQSGLQQLRQRRLIHHLLIAPRQ